MTSTLSLSCSSAGEGEIWPKWSESSPRLSSSGAVRIEELGRRLDVCCAHDSRELCWFCSPRRTGGRCEA